MSRKVKVVKKNLAAAAKPLGVNPLDPWSAKSGVSEASEEELLSRFLKAKGINPNFVAKDTKIAHSKSGEFIKWRRDHDFMEQTVTSPTLQHHKALEKRSKALGNIGAAQQKYSMHEEEEVDEAYSMDDVRRDAAAHLTKSMDKQSDARITAHKNPPAKKSFLARVGQKQINMVKGAYHGLTKEEMLDEGIFTDDESIAKHLVKKYGKNVQSHDIKLAMHFHPEPHKTSLERIAGHVKRLTSGVKPVTEAQKLTSLDKFRRAAAEREKKHDEIEKSRQAAASQGKENMSAAIDRLEKHLNKEEAGISKTKETSFHKKLDKLVHSTFGKRKDEMKMKEEVEQIDEISKSTLASYKDKSTASLKNAQINRDAAEAGKHMSKGFADLHAKSDAIAKKRVKGLKGYLQRKVGMKPTSEEVKLDEVKHYPYRYRATYHDPDTGKMTHVMDFNHKSIEAAKKHAEGSRLQRKDGKDDILHSVVQMKEDVYQDSQAATQTAFDMGTTPNQTEPTHSRKREMSKSARMIKALYKKKGMVKEDMYDHEKEDKSVQTYGKKPKMNSTKKEESFGENKPDAAAIMTGGTTLTGEKRDDVEIDPMMRNKPGQNTFDKGFGKKGS
jgi:hypothetical protein